MLSKLYIKNYLLIEELNLDFNPGFSVITGETGAGKSIILGALSLLLGKRADTDVLDDKSSKCVVEGTFLINENDKIIKDIFTKEDLDFETSTIIRREIVPSGKSRAFINDTPVNLTTLKTISEKIVNIHSQQENLALAVAEYRIQIIDTTANTANILNKYRDEYFNLQNTKSQLKKTLKEFAKAKQDIDYFTFQSEQLQNANLSDNNELESLEEQSEILENAEEIRSVLTNSVNIIDNENISIDSLLRDLKNGLSRISQKYRQANELCNRVESIIIELHDIKDTIYSDIERAEINPELLDTVNTRIDLINSLLTKHNAVNIEELKDKLNSYLHFIHGTEEIEEKIKQLQSSTSQLEKSCINIAQKLSKQRQRIFNQTEEYIIDQLKQLGIPDANFKIENNISAELTENGIDNINFLFSANKSVNIQALEKVASGGEFSRLMLTLKSLLVKASGISSIIFDEIDTGVSGEIANKMGKIMKKISSETQVISITHLPQVAALGNYHYKVFKETINDKTISNIKLLNDDTRINEIAAMISGEKMTKEAIENAKTLMSH